MTDHERMQQLLRERAVRLAARRIFERSTRESALRIIRRTNPEASR
jgi:hypothetical protein